MPAPIAVLRTERDVNANLLRDTRGLRREHAAARDTWYASLPWERKEETLFELEMLLKGIACFGNARNHPGEVTAKSAVAQDFTEQLRILRDACSRVVTLTKQLLGDRERAYTFTRYLESVLPEDAARGRLVQEQLSQDTPEEALLVLRNSFGHFVELADGSLRLGRISNQLYVSFHAIVTREVGRNAFFNPLVQLEFRAEFDRIRIAEVLEALADVESESAHRVLALSFLTLCRATRYLRLVDQYAADASSTRRAYVILAVLRSDLRALARYLARRAGDTLAEGLERDILAVPAGDLADRSPFLHARARSLTSLRTALQSVAGSLRVDARKVFRHDVPGPHEGVAGSELGPQLVIAAAELRAAVHHAIQVLCAELRPGEPAPELSMDTAARIAASERLRRDVWMFRQILRAFVAKSDASAATGGHSTAALDRWGGQTSFQFVRDFLGHFRSIGYQLVRSHDYARLDPFLDALGSLRDVDLLDPEAMAACVDECRAFLDFLDTLFEAVGSRTELAGSAFDRVAATETLMMYLGRV